MSTQVALKPFSDNDGNVIETSLELENSRINFRGKNNRLVVAPGAKIERVIVNFDGDNALVQIGPSRSSSAWSIRVGQDSTVKIGANVSTTLMCTISAVEGSKVTIGDDVMLASGNQIRADDGHAIFDVNSGKRVNVSRDISIGNHVWLAFDACVLGGSTIGDGTVIGFRSLVTSNIPNNVIAVGSPARVVRRDIAWERPHLSLTAPAYRPDASVIKKTSKYWNHTIDTETRPVVRQKSLARRIARKLGLTKAVRALRRRRSQS